MTISLFGVYFDKETGNVYLRARYYDPSLGRFTQQDGYEYMKYNEPLSLNLYTYCINNPIRYFDPSGHDLDDQIKIDNDPKNPIKIFVEGNTVTISVYVNISGDGADKTCGNSGKTYRQLAVEGIQEVWAQDYKDVFGENVTVQVWIDDLGVSKPRIMATGQKSIPIVIKDTIGRAEVNHGLFRWWSKKDPGDMTLFTWGPYSNSNNGYVLSPSGFKGVVTHEFGHLLGIGDAYEEEGYRNRAPGWSCPWNDIMRSNTGKVTAIDIAYALYAFQYNKFQEFPQE